MYDGILQPHSLPDSCCQLTLMLGNNKVENQSVCFYSSLKLTTIINKLFVNHQGI